MKLILAVVLLMFLFWGEPDVFDLAVQVTKTWLSKGQL
jgi:type IV secretory pathway TrbL component